MLSQWATPASPSPQNSGSARTQESDALDTNHSRRLPHPSAVGWSTLTSTNQPPFTPRSQHSRRQWLGSFSKSPMLRPFSSAPRSCTAGLKGRPQSRSKTARCSAPPQIQQPRPQGPPLPPYSTACPWKTTPHMPVAPRGRSRRLGGNYEARDRQHGTGMASLIIRGDLTLNDAPLTSPLDVRPILRPDPSDFQRPRREAMPVERFPQDLLEIAVRRLKAGTTNNPATAPTVQVVNLLRGGPVPTIRWKREPLGRTWTTSLGNITCSSS